MIDSALIYAAGRGTRMGALTDTTPKPLLKLQDKALIDYGIERLREAKITNLHVNAAYLSDQIEAHFGGQNISIHLEPNGPFETGGTLKSLAPILPEAIITLNSDVVFFDDNPMVQLQNAWRNSWDALLLLIPREAAIGHAGQGDFFWDGQKLSRRNDAPTAPYIYTGTQIIRPKRAQEFDEKVFSTNKIWDTLIAQKRIGAVVYEGRWMDLGNQAALERASFELST